MIVGHCIHGLGVGGAQSVIAAIAAGASEDIRHVVYSCEDGVMAQPVRDAGATVHVIPRSLPKFDPGWARGLAAAMRRDRVDVVHTHLFGDSLHGMLAARLAGSLPVIVTLHIGPEGLTSLQRLGYRWVLPRAVQVVACSASVERGVAGWLPEARVATIANGIDLEPRTPSTEEVAALRQSLGLAPEGRVIGCIGRLTPQKGCDRIIAAFADQLRDEAAQLVFIGEGPLRADLEAQVRSLGLEGRVIFAGPRSDVAGLWAAIDVVVFGSHYEGLPMALLEAMAAGRCVVAVDIEAIADAVRSGEHALLVEPERIGEALRRVVTDDALRGRLGVAARSHQQKHFSAVEMVRRYEDVYRAAGSG